MRKYNCIPQHILHCLLGLLLILGLSAGSARADTVTYEVTYGQTEARTILNMVNTFRTGGSWVWNEANTQKVTVNPLPALKWDYDLEKAAIIRAEELALRYSHTRPDGSKFCSGYTYTSAAENIAYGYATAQAVFNAWREENENYAGQGHRRNMLSGNVTAIAVGHVRSNGTDFWAMELRSPVVSTTATPAKSGSSTLTGECKPIKEGTGSSTGHQYDAYASVYKPNIGEAAQPIALTLKVDQRQTGNYAYVAFSSNPKVLTVDEDLKVTAHAPGKASVEITVTIEGYTLENPLVLDFDITPINLGLATITLPKYEYDYTGSEITPKPLSVKYRDIELVEGVDYRLRYSGNKDYRQGNYAYISADATDHPDCRTTGTVTERFSIIRCDITKLGIRLPQTEYTYTGESVCPDIVSPGLVRDEDYHLEYYENYGPGTARVRVTGWGNYQGTIYLEYTIKSAPKPETQPYVEPKDNTPAPTTPVPSAENTKKNTGKTTTVKVKLTKPSLSSAKNKKGKKIQVKWKKQKNITGYQLRYKTGKVTQIVTIPKASAKSVMITGLKKKKTYTISLRSYKTVNGTTYYSKWSKTKKVKVKK